MRCVTRRCHDDATDIFNIALKLTKPLGMQASISGAYPAPCGAGAPPFLPFLLVYSLPRLLLFLLFSFFISDSLYLFSSVHPFPFYQSSPTPFPCRRS